MHLLYQYFLCTHIPVMVLVNVLVEPGSVEEGVRVVGTGLQPHKQPQHREDEVRVAIVLHSEVDFAVVSVQNPAGQETRHACELRTSDGQSLQVEIVKIINGINHWWKSIIMSLLTIASFKKKLF